MSSFNSMTPLLKYRWFWYQNKLFDKLMRFKHGLLILLGLFIPSAGFLISIITKPILIVIQPASLGSSFLFNIILIQFTCLAWVIAQKDALYPQNIQSYIQSLPIPSWINRMVDVVLILVANNILWIPFVFTILQQSQSVSADANLAVIRIFTIMVSILAIQAMWFYKKSLSVATLILFDSILYLNKIFPSAILLSLTIISYLFLVKFINSISFQKCFSFFNKPSKHRKLNLTRRLPLLSMQFAILWRIYPIQLIFRIVISLGVIAIGYGVVVFGGAVSPTQMSIIIVSMLVLILSDIYPLLHETRSGYSLFLKSLPFSEFHWFLLDFILFTVMTITLSSIYFLLLTFTHKLQLNCILHSLIILLPMGIVLAYIKNRFLKQGTLISTLIMIAYSAHIQWYLI